MKTNQDKTFKEFIVTHSCTCSFCMDKTLHSSTMNIEALYQLFAQRFREEMEEDKKKV